MDMEPQENERNHPFTSYISLPPAFAPHLNKEPTDATPTTTDDSFVEATKSYLASALNFTSKFRATYQYNANDFFVSGEHFAEGRVPPEFEELAGTDVRGLLELAIGEGDDGIQPHWPELLKDFVRGCRIHSLPRRHRDARLFPEDKVGMSLPKGQESKLLRGIPAKKLDEVRLLAPVVAREAKGATVVDLGCGQGYLTSLLARGYGIDAVGVDFQPIQTDGAEKRREKTGTGEGSLRFVCQKIDGDLDLDEVAGTDPFIVAGLHTCGDLGPSLLRLYGKSRAEACVFVGCCYNLLTPSGFPMSNFMRSFPESELSAINPQGLNVACQNTEGWTEEVELAKMFERLFYRAVLQLVLVENGLTCSKYKPGCLFDGVICTVHGQPEVAVGRTHSKAKLASFPIYVASAIPKGGLSSTAISTEVAENTYQRVLKDLPRYRAAWTLRALTGATIEGIVLADRWLWCRENGIECGAAPGWDAEGSPRNWVFVCRGEQK